MEVNVPPCMDDKAVRATTAATTTNNNDEDEGEVEYEEEAGEDDSDASTLRVLLTTDNHLGYLECDPIRGLDSFAAFEEILGLARQHKVNMVLLSGDLFHENKPSRNTMHIVSFVSDYCRSECGNGGKGCKMHQNYSSSMLFII